MLLHEFMSGHREEILEACREILHRTVTATADLDDDVELFFDEVYRALKRDSGHPTSESPLPGKSEVAARIGLQPQRAGIEPAKVPLIFGAISGAIGRIGEYYDLSMGAEEYRIFNECIDAGVATSIENFWDTEQEQRRQRVTESFGYLAHELRVALGNAVLAFKLLRSGNVGINGRTAAVLGNNLTRMEALVGRTLGSVRLDSGTDPDLHPIRVASVLRHLQASSLPDRAVTITLEVDESLHVAADELLLSSALGNLLHNAIKFTRTGGQVVLRCYSELESVVIEVEDECGGLPPGSGAELFRPFVKGYQRRENIGLGLAITKRAVEAMRGTILITDLPGHGCVFAVSFPHVTPAAGDAWRTVPEDEYSGR